MKCLYKNADTIHLVQIDRLGIQARSYIDPQPFNPIEPASLCENMPDYLL
jgi:hypothetical protein